MARTRSASCHASGGLSGNVIEEALEGGETLIARANVVVALALERVEEPPDPLGGEVGDLQGGQLAASVFCRERQEQSDGVSIAADGGRTEPLASLEMILEECVQQAAERGHGHAWIPLQTGSAKRSKRWLACWRRSAVTVRYTAVETGLT